MSFLVRFEDETTTVVHGADAYEQEGPLTTFFDRNGGGRLASAFTLRVASFRTVSPLTLIPSALGTPCH